MTKNDIKEVKKNIEGCIGQEVLLSGSLGRNKTFEKRGTIFEATTNNFSVKLEGGMIKENWSYVDVLTKNVKLQVSDGSGEYSSILDSVATDITL